MNKTSPVPIDQLTQPPYASILCFPNPTSNEVHNRIEELRGLGVSALEFSGSASVFGVKVPVVGKGFVGIVVVGYLNEEKVAVKILRLDSGRADLLHEAAMLSKANAAGVGPRLVAASKNLLVMQLIDGELLPNWLKSGQELSVVRRVLGEVLEQCWRLDEAGLDHGELSKAPKHLLVDKAGKVFIVDFETASAERHVANVTAVCQYLFHGGSSSAQLIAETLGLRNTKQLIELLRNYKKDRTRRNFEAIIQVALS